MSNTNVCTEVVANDLCSGCGICAGVCPKRTLSMEWNRYGEYIAVDKHNECLDQCRLCLKVCPFSPDTENEDALGSVLFSNNIVGMQHRSETGYYLNSYVGYSTVQNHRLNGASGGLTTWTLEALLTTGDVDQVVCVSACSEKEKLFTYTICSTPEQIRSCARSCYYPVEMSEVVRHMITSEGRYAIVGLPCFVKAMRLAMKHNSILNRRVKYLFGLVCGQQKGKFFTEYVSALKGADPHGISSVQFRIKYPGRPASDYGLKYECDSLNGGHNSNVVFFTEGMGQAWCRRYFTLNACNFCDDIFSELADAAFMDAWLPEYSQDWRGTSIVLVRAPDIQKLIEAGQTTNELTLTPLAIERVIQSQAGVVFQKRKKLSDRLAWQIKKNQPVINKRTRPSRLTFFNSLGIAIEHATIKQSKSSFAEQKAQERFSLEAFQAKMKKNAQGYKFIYKAIRKLKRIKHRILGSFSDKA